MGTGYRERFDRLAADDIQSDGKRRLKLSQAAPHSAGRQVPARM